MRIALINEESQLKKNEFIFRILEKVSNSYHHDVFNFGVEEGKNMQLDDVGAGILAGILLSSKVVDFVITGSLNGEGTLMSANSMPDVLCGFVTDEVDARLFMKMNGGNAISIPFGKNFGVGSEIKYERIFEAICETEKLSGYPKEKKEVQEMQHAHLLDVKRSSQISMENILEEIDKDVLKNMIQNEYFEENFFKYSENDTISEFLKDIIDAWEDSI